MGTFVWLYSPRTNSSHFIMNSFVVFATLLAAACAAPQTLVNTVNKGPQTGPLTALVGGDLVQTPKGLRSLALEGFSEDLDQDGFVDPIAPAVPAPIVAPVPAPIVRTVPFPAAPVFAQAPIAAPVFAQAPIAAAPVAAAPVAAPIVRNVVQPAIATPFFNPAPVASPFFNPAAVAGPVFRTPSTVVNAVAPSPAVIRTISPIPVPVRAAPSAVTFDSRLHG